MEEIVIHSIQISDLTIEEFIQAFDNFCHNEISENKFNKIEYLRWKQIRSFIKIATVDKETIVRLQMESNKPQEIFAISGGGYNISQIGYSNDNSFGEFCFKKFFNKKRKEDMKDMKKNFGFEFGTCEYDNVRISMYGLAVKNAAGVYVSYNPTTKEIVDVDIMNFEGGKFLFKMPVGIKDIKAGDVILHNRKPIIVTEVGETDILGVDVISGENKSIMLTRNMFGFNFATKIVSLFNAIGEAPTPDAPFGNLLPFMLLGNESADADPMTMALLAMSMNDKGMDMSNPMWMYFLCKDNANMKDIAPFMLMSMNK